MGYIKSIAQDTEIPLRRVVDSTQQPSFEEVNGQIKAKEGLQPRVQSTEAESHNTGSTEREVNL